MPPGTLWSWGTNYYPVFPGSFTAAPVEGLGEVTAFAGGGNHSLALATDGTVWAWGGNYYGQLGTGTLVNSSIPVRVSGLTHTTAVAAGFYHSLAVKSDGMVWAWGDGGYGQLGTGTNTSSATPVAVVGLTSVTAVSAGIYHSLALKADGTVWAWGAMFPIWDGQAWGFLFSSSIPVQVAGLADIRAIAAGGDHSLALKIDGTAWAWGGNYAGQLGNGTTSNSAIPVQVVGVTGIRAIAAGAGHTLAVKSDGSVWGWGDNFYGQLGNVYAGRINSSPVQVSGLTGGIAVAAGFYHSLALKVDGAVWAWGNGGYGQLDNGTNYPPTSISTTPVLVSSISEVVAVAAGAYYSLALTSTPITGNQPPVADAGADQALLQIGTTVQLDGSKSYDLDGDPLTFAWSLLQKPPGSEATLSSTVAPNPTFVADLYGDYVTTLVVTDSLGASSTPASTTVSFTNVKPVANAGLNQAVTVGERVVMDGSGSFDANLDPLTYSWSFMSQPAGTTATLVNATTINPTFIADVAGAYVVGLIVNDRFINSDPSNVTITATSTQDQAIQTLKDAIAAINGLSASVLKNLNLKNALTNKITAVLQDIDQGLYQRALDKLQNDILAKTDGCAKMAAPDKNDWLIACVPQRQVYALIVQAIDLLTYLI